MQLIACTPTPGRGVHTRAVGTVPLEQVQILPSSAPHAGRVRIQALGGMPLGGRDIEGAATRGQRQVTRANGEVAIAVGLPGAVDVGGEKPYKAGYELVASAFAGSSPDVDRASPLVAAAPTASVHGAGLALVGTLGGPEAAAAFSIGLRGARLAYDWSFGDCAGGAACTEWNPKSETATESAIALGGHGAVGLWLRASAPFAFIVGGGVDLSPTFDDDSAEEFQCDDTGRCTNGLMPEAPATVITGFGYLLAGVEWSPATWGRAFVILVPLTAHGGPETERRLQGRVGLEVTF